MQSSFLCESRVNMIAPMKKGPFFSQTTKEDLFRFLVHFTSFLYFCFNLAQNTQSFMKIYNKI